MNEPFRLCPVSAQLYTCLLPRCPTAAGYPETHIRSQIHPQQAHVWTQNARCLPSRRYPPWPHTAKTASQEKMKPRFHSRLRRTDAGVAISVRKRWMATERSEEARELVCTSGNTYADKLAGHNSHGSHILDNSNPTHRFQ